MKNWSQYESISTLNSIIEGSEGKYEYNLARYLNKPDVDIRNASEYSSWDIFGYSLNQDTDLWNGPNFNVIKSVIDSLVSKLSNNKTRPFFNTVNGTYFTKKVVKQCQQYFDHLYEKIDADSLIASAFRNACIFDIGYILIDPFTYEIYSVPSYQIAMLNSEQKRTKLLMVRKNCPTTFFAKYNIQIDSTYADFAMYVDTIDKKAKLFVNGQERKSIAYTANILPVVEVYFNEPIEGLRTVSVADELEGIQTHIDLLNSKISTCAQLTPGMTVYVHDTSNIKKSDINNRTGNVYEVRMPVGASNVPVQFVNPAPHDPQWLSELDFYVQKAYDMIGISQLSAQSRKPSGLDSGAALQTMEDIESDRFETQVRHYIRAYTDLAKLIIEVLPEDHDIISPDEYTSSVSWADVKRESNKFRIQYSAMSVLSKDPSEKLKQLLQMSQVGLIGAEQIAEYMQVPDLEDAYSNAAAVKNAIQEVITRAIDQGIYDIPEYINYAELSKQIAVQQNLIFASLSDKDNTKALISIKRLNHLDDMLIGIMEKNGFIDPVSTVEETQVSSSGLGAAANTNSQVISSADAMEGENGQQEQQ